MCGIAGYINLDGSPADASLLWRMIRTLHHRGPDDSDVSVHGSTGLAHSRLSIIDLSGGRQPMADERGSLCIVFNGEIFNYVELRADLLRKGHRFLNHSDTEVIVHLYREYGPDCVHHMNGQWAFAIWDSTNRRLFLSRDRLGVRPLYYSAAGRSVVFGSEIKALFAHPAIPREMDLKALGQIFTFWFPLPPGTAFRNVLEVPPGNSLLIENGRMKLCPYWKPEFPAEASAPLSSPRDEERYREELRDLLLDATRIRLRADVPVGAYLSGGLDSSVITAIARGLAGSSVDTFSVSFDDPALDESKYQWDVARSLGTRHHSVRCSPRDIARIFPEVIRHAERPLLRTAPAPMFLLSRLVRASGFKVVLTGEGADEFFGGYDIYKEAKVRAFCSAQPQSKLRPHLLRRLYPYIPEIQKQPISWLQAFFHAGQNDLANPFFSHLPRWKLGSRLHLLFSREVRRELEKQNPYQDLAGRLPRGFAAWPLLARAQYLECSLLLPQYLLSSQGDRMAMANSVEGRYPFLDHRVVAFASALPQRLKMNVLDEKYLLKRTFRQMIPEDITRRRKQPYRAPDAISFFDPQTATHTEEYVGDLLSPERIRREGIFDCHEVQKTVERARRGQTAGFLPNAALVGVLSTQLLIHQFISHSKEIGAHATN
ncbi:MAG TPA: asparagine synthase (glutamine-hydrolyzing) [Bryobacteraceae bacterium]|nr:asparagine synthase (glutamine-hydrolyzing) [Bryobacteraceae bacterium]